MPKEMDGFRDQLESVISAFPDKECLTRVDVAKYCGCTEKTAGKRYPFVRNGADVFISRVCLARYLVGVSQPSRYSRR